MVCCSRAELEAACCYRKSHNSSGLTQPLSASLSASSAATARRGRSPPRASSAPTRPPHASKGSRLSSMHRGVNAESRRRSMYKVGKKAHRRGPWTRTGPRQICPASRQGSARGSAARFASSVSWLGTGSRSPSFSSHQSPPPTRLGSASRRRRPCAPQHRSPEPRKLSASARSR